MIKLKHFELVTMCMLLLVPSQQQAAEVLKKSSHSDRRSKYLGWVSSKKSLIENIMLKYGVYSHSLTSPLFILRETWRVYAEYLYLAIYFYHG